MTTTMVRVHTLKPAIHYSPSPTKWERGPGAEGR